MSTRKRVPLTPAIWNQSRFTKCAKWLREVGCSTEWQEFGWEEIDKDVQDELLKLQVISDTEEPQ